MDIIIVESRQDEVKKLEKIFKKLDEFEFMIKDNLLDALSLVEILPSLKRVLVLDDLNDSSVLSASRKIDQIVEANSLECLFYFKTLPARKKEYFKETIKTNDLKALVESILNINKSKVVYQKLTLGFVAKLDCTPCDLYISIGGNESIKYIKVFKEGEVIDQSRIDSYHEKATDFLYLLSKDVARFIDDVSSRLVSEDDELYSGEINFKKVHLQSFEILTEFGFSEASLSIAEKSISDLMNKIESSAPLSGLLSEVYKSSNNFSYKFSYMTGLVSYMLLSQFEWKTDSMRKSLLYASIFNDVFLKKEELAFYDEAQLEGLDASTKKNILSHAQLSYEKYYEMTSIPEEATKIILQHHGSTTGNGFYNQIDERIGPLVLIFIYSERFCLKILNNKTRKVNFRQITSEIDTELSHSKLNSCREALIKSLTN